MIRHVVMWKLNAEDATGRAEAVEAIAAALEPLVDVIPELLSLTVSANVIENGFNWDAILVSDFATAQDVATYQKHPAHVAAAEVPGALAGTRVAVDYEV